MNEAVCRLDLTLYRPWAGQSRRDCIGGLGKTDARLSHAANGWSNKGCTKRSGRSCVYGVLGGAVTVKRRALDKGPVESHCPIHAWSMSVLWSRGTKVIPQRESSPMSMALFGVLWRALACLGRSCRGDKR